MAGRHAIKSEPLSFNLAPFAVLFAILITYVLTHFVLPSISSNSYLTIYLSRPLLWIAVAVVAVVASGNSKRLSFSAKLVDVAIIIGFIQILLAVAAGAFIGFGKSPYSFTSTGLILNFILIVSSLIGMEFSRAYLIAKSKKRFFATKVVTIAVLYTFLSISLGMITNIENVGQGITTFGAYIFPSFAENLFATLLAFLGGPFAAIGYMGVLQAFEWFSPILPDLPWAVKCIIGALVPMAGMSIVAYMHRTEIPGAKGSKGEKEEDLTSLAGWLVVALFGLCVIWFSSGITGMQPLLVASGSMQPVFNVGDVVIVKKADPDDIKKGDVIQFRSKHGYTIHRVVRVEKEGGRLCFMTKGDANNTVDDDLVNTKSLVGRVILKIPKIGWIGVGVKELVTKLL